MLTED